MLAQGPLLFARKRAIGTCPAERSRVLNGLRNDNWGKRTIAQRRRYPDRSNEPPSGAINEALYCPRQKIAGGPGPPAAQVPPCVKIATGAGVAALRAPSPRLPHPDRPR